MNEITWMPLLAAGCGAEGSLFPIVNLISSPIQPCGLREFLIGFSNGQECDSFHFSHVSRLDELRLLRNKTGLSLFQLVMLKVQNTKTHSVTPLLRYADSIVRAYDISSLALIAALKKMHRVPVAHFRLVGKLQSSSPFVSQTSTCLRSNAKSDSAGFPTMARATVAKTVLLAILPVVAAATPGALFGVAGLW